MADTNFPKDHRIKEITLAQNVSERIFFLFKLNMPVFLLDAYYSDPIIDGATEPDVSCARNASRNRCETFL